MKKQIPFLVIIFCIGALLYGCSNNNPVDNPIDKTKDSSKVEKGYSSGGVLRYEVVSTSNNSCVFDLDIFVVDGNGKFINGLSPENFTISNAYFTDYQNGIKTGDSTYFQFEKYSVTPSLQTELSPYSAAMLFDQSGSIRTTDPNNNRLIAAKTFLNAVDTSDNVIVSAFSSGGDLPYEPVTIWGTFSNNAKGFLSTVENLKSLVNGGTPLYVSTISMIQYTQQNAPSINKAVIVFTDGEDTDGKFTPEDVISNARSSNIKVFTVGLGTGTKTNVLANIANATGGSYIQASDAQYLISAYGSLGNILRGRATYYRTRWRVTKSKSTFDSGTSFNTSLKVNRPNGTTIYIPFAINF